MIFFYLSIASVVTKHRCVSVLHKNYIARTVSDQKQVTEGESTDLGDQEVVFLVTKQE